MKQKKTALIIPQELHQEMLELKGETGKSLTWLIVNGLMFALKNKNFWVNGTAKVQ